MSELRELYQEVILDHGRHPRNHGPLADANHSARGENPLCGDRMTVHVKLAGERIEAVRFEGAGCAISMASASMMTEAARGLTLDQARTIFGVFRDLVTGAGPSEEGLGKLVVFAGVREFPVRVKCATLAWHTLDAALRRRDEPCSTE